MQSDQSHAANLIPEQRYLAANVANEDIRLLFAGLLEEIVNSALLTAATASIANWMLAKKDGTSRSNLTCYLPPVPAFFQQSLLKLCVHIDMFSVSSRLREYYDRLELLRNLTLRFAAQSEEPGAHDSVGIEVLSGAWQELAGVCRAAVSELGEQLAEDETTRNNERYLKVLEVLSEIELGYHPCVSTDGVVTVPFWLERRTLRRKQMNLQAYIVVGESIEKVAVLNASDKGIGVLGLSNVSAGTKVHLLVRPGFSIDGQVVWAKDGRAGIALEQSLPAESSLCTLIN